MDAAVERARWWSWRRQRLDRTSRGVEDCLRSVVGVTSVNPHGPLSLLARVPRLMKGAAVEGVIGTKRAVRIPAMRGSVFMVSAETVDRIFGATRLDDAAWPSMLTRAGIGERAFDTLTARILEAARAPATIEEIRAALPRPPRILGDLLRLLCAQGRLLIVGSRSIRANDETYVATESWLGRALEPPPAAEALAWLAGEYLSAFGPVTTTDLAWWTGHPERVAAEALATHEPTDVGGGLLLHARDLKAFEGMRPMTGRVNLLPKQDCYMMGYAPEGRARFADKGVLDIIYGTSGDAAPVVLVEGEVAGTWELRPTKARARISLAMFDRPGPALRARLEEEARMVATFFELEPAIELERVSRRAQRQAARPAKPKASRKKASTPRGSSRRPTRSNAPKRTRRR